jgi:DNA-binding SARP family transcriptional activator/ATP/maltotriose-dependent transcriptional regulator MalT
VWALLAYVVLSDQPVSRTRVATLLFPDANDPLAALRWNLHELRRLLGAESGLRGDPISVRLAPGDVLDVAVVRSGSWRQAVLIANPGAELLQGLSFAGCPGFEAWLTAERRHLRSVAGAVLHESVLARLTAGQIDQAVATAAQLVAANPYDEELQELYVRCLLAAGDPAGARRQRQAAVDLIRRDLGVQPGRGLLTVCQPAADGGLDADAASITAWSNLGLVWLHAGAYEPALASMRRAITAARRRDDPALLLRALLICGYGLGVSSLGGAAESATVQHEAMALAAQLGDERYLGVAELQYARTELARGQYLRALHWADVAATWCAGDPVKIARVGAVRGTAMVDTGRYDEGIEELERALSSAPVEADPRNAAYALSMLGKAHLLRGDTAAAIAPLDRALDLARVHWIGFGPWPEALRAEVALRCGQLDRADRMFQEAYALARNFQYSPCWESAAARGLGLVAAANGAVDRAVSWLDDAYSRCARGTATYQWVRCNALDSLCELAIANAMPAAAAWLAAFEEQAGWFGMHGFLTRGVEHRENLGHSIADRAA